MTQDHARQAFESLPDELRCPGMHPCCVAADARRDATARPVFFVHRQGAETWYHGAHLCPIPGTDLFDVQSPYGYGGPVATTRDPDFLRAAWEAWDRWCAENRVLVEFIRFHPLLDNGGYFRGDVFDNRATVWIDLRGEDLMAGYRTRVRTAVRKALKNGAGFRWSSAPQDREAFIRLYTEDMRRLGADELYFFPPDYFAELFACPQTRLGLCEREGELLSCALFLIEGHNAEYHLSASTQLGRKNGAVNLLLHAAAQEARQAGARRLHLGGGFDASPDNPLLFFKSGFSPNSAMFRIGRRIHRPDEYARMREHWIATHPGQSARILFYRF